MASYHHSRKVEAQADRGARLADRVAHLEGVVRELEQRRDMDIARALARWADEIADIMPPTTTPVGQRLNEIALAMRAKS